jgi:hypothetical protein
VEDQTVYLWRPPHGQDQGIGQVLSMAFSEILGGAIMDDATAKVWWSGMQEHIEADAEMAGQKLVVYRAAPDMVLQICDTTLDTRQLGNLLSAIQIILDQREAA